MAVAAVLAVAPAQAGVQPVAFSVVIPSKARDLLLLAQFARAGKASHEDVCVASG